MMDSLTSLATNAGRSLRFPGTPTERIKVFRTLLALERTTTPTADSEVEVTILGHRMRGFRGKSLCYLFGEIFLQDQYRFQTSESEPLIIDCGANVGFSLLYFKLKHPHARIVAFEADPYAFRMLEHNVAVNRLDKVDLRQVAVGDAEGQIPFFISSNRDSFGSLVSSTRPDRGGDEKIMVVCERLSKTLSAFDRVDLVKVDVEGAEWAVLDDLVTSRMLAKPARYIIEYHHQINGEPARLSQFLAPFENAGYRYHVIARIGKPAVFQDVLLHLWRD